MRIHIGCGRADRTGGWDVCLLHPYYVCIALGKHDKGDGGKEVTGAESDADG